METNPVVDYYFPAQMKKMRYLGYTRFLDTPFMFSGKTTTTKEGPVTPEETLGFLDLLVDSA